MQYTELHLHTHYSAGLDGVGSPEEYMTRANELGITHLAVTDHGTLSGHRNFQLAAKDAGITPILGAELYFSPTTRFDRRPVKDRDDGTANYHHLTALAQNENGLKNLNTISTEAWTSGYYSKPRTDIDLLEEYSDDIIILSGCVSGPLAKALENNRPDLAEKWAVEFKRVFKDRFFIELMGHNSIALNKGLLDIAAKHHILPVITSDCHHVRKEDLWVQEAILILSTKPKIAKDFDFAKSQKMDMLERFNYLYPGRTMSFQEFNLHLNSAVEHKTALLKQGIDTKPIENTNVVASMIGDYPFYQGLDLLPKPKGNPDEILRKKAYAGLKKRGLADKPEYVERIEEELAIIKEKNFASYFLIAENAVTWARQQKIMVGPGRGSDGSCLVLYCLYVTGVDPIKHGLLLFRFIDPSRSDYPDADLDFQDSRRHEVKAYMRRKFTHVASIATFGYFKDSGTIRDAARVFKIPLSEVNRTLKNISSFEQFVTSPDTRDFRRKYPEVEKLVRRLRGHIRTVGMHAGGLVIANQPLANIVPVQTAKDKNNASGPRVPYIANDKRQVADVGLIKFDFLGLKALSVLQDTVDMIHERHDPNFDLYDLTFDDPEVYTMLSEGYTKGVFQAEAAPYTKMLLGMGGVKNFSELSASNALVRPGASNSSFGGKFIEGKNNGNYEYIHADTKWFTEETYGSVIYQEQAMLLCTELAGMSMAEANKVRKAISSKVAADLAVWKDEFVEGASNKIGRDKAEALWHDLEASADYSFNKSHAVAYSMMTYWTAWLKLRYPIEFMTAVLKNEEDKNSILDYLIEARRLGIKIMLPHVNVSGVQFEIQSNGQGDYIRIGLANIKFISGKIGNRLIAARPFRNYAHLRDVINTKGSGLSTRVLQSLDAIGGATFEDHPRTGEERKNFYEYLNIPAFETSSVPPRIQAQFRPLSEFCDDEAFVVMGMVREIKTGPNWARVEIVDETGTAGAFTSEHNNIETGHMYVFLIANNSVSRYIKVTDLVNGEDAEFQEFLEATEFEIPEGQVRVVSFKPRRTKAGKRMADAVFADSEKNLQGALVFPSVFMKAYTRCREGKNVSVVFKQTKEGTVFVDDVF